jgi:Zn-dependent protease
MNMMSSSSSSNKGVDLGCLAGIPIHLQYSCFILVGIEVLAVMWQYHEPIFTILMFTLYGPVLLGTILIHELGHALTTKRLGGKVEGIVLSPLGGFALCGPTSGRVVEDFYVAIAGPLAHLPQIAIWVALFALLNHGEFMEFQADINLNSLKLGGWSVFWSIVSVQATMMNVALFVFNLAIPAYPMDGGRCLAALLVMFGCSAYTAGLITSITATLIGFGFMVLGFYPVPTFSGILLALFGTFIVSSSLELRKMTLQGRVHAHPLFDRDCYHDNNTNKFLVDEETGEAIENIISIV